MTPTFPPTPHSARPKLEVVGDQQRVQRAVGAWRPGPSRPSAVAPLIVTGLPLPPVPCPKQVALGLVLIDVVPVFSVSSDEDLAGAGDDPQLDGHLAGAPLGARDRGDGENQRDGQRARSRQPE